MNQIKKIGVIGKGKMGSSIFFYLLGFDFELRWLCSSEEGRLQALKSFEKKMKILGRSGVMTEEEHARKLKETAITAGIKDLADCDLVIEAITEDVESKRSLFTALDPVLPAGCILTSNSSSITPSEWNPSPSRSGDTAGMHFFFPVQLKKTVELILSGKTSMETRDGLFSFLQKIDKKPFLQDEGDAFLLNRLLLDTQAGAYRIFLEGKLALRQIDAIVKERLFPAGIFEFMDHVGLDVMLASIRTYAQRSGGRESYQPLITKLEELVSQGRLGLKTHSGFYTYCVPVEQRESTAETTDEEALRSAATRLEDIFHESVHRMLQSANISSSDFQDILEDYLGVSMQI